MIDVWDGVALVGVVLATAGLYLLAGLAWTLLVLGVLMIAGGIAGARAPGLRRNEKPRI